eukprot:577983-Pyramimonas_sp.AAC.1
MEFGVSKLLLSLQRGPHLRIGAVLPSSGALPPQRGPLFWTPQASLAPQGVAGPAGPTGTTGVAGRPT